ISIATLISSIRRQSKTFYEAHTVMLIAAIAHASQTLNFFSIALLSKFSPAPRVLVHIFANVLVNCFTLATLILSAENVEEIGGRERGGGLDLWRELCDPFVTRPYWNPNDRSPRSTGIVNSLFVLYAVYTLSGFYVVIFVVVSCAISVEYFLHIPFEVYRRVLDSRHKPSLYLYQIIPFEG